MQVVDRVFDSIIFSYQVNQSVYVIIIIQRTKKQKKD